MAGISQYFHGEQGEVAARAWIPDKETLTYRLDLRGDPHRASAFDYGSDVAIDPALRPGERAVYLRLSPYSGLWTAAGRRFHPDTGRALERVMVNRKQIDEYRERIERRDETTDWLQEMSAHAGVPLEGSPAPGSLSDRAVAAASIFLSYSRRNVLLARTIADYLSREANGDVWFDLAQSSEAPAHTSRIATWLRDAVHRCRVFALLVTRQALESDWVPRELGWAQERLAGGESDFHIVVLKADESVPPAPAGAQLVIDCAGLPYGELLEELYAAVYRREGRQTWMAEQRRRLWPDAEPRSRGDYAHLRSDGGVASTLSWARGAGGMSWTLEYEADGALHRTTGGGEKDVVDPGIRPGDWVGFFMFSGDTPLWMRAGDLGLSPNDVIGAYHRKLHYPPGVQLANFALATLGVVVIGGVAAFFWTFLGRDATRPPEFTPEQFLRILVAHRATAALAAAAWGLHQLIGVAHPRQVERRGDVSMARYFGRGLQLVFLGALWYPVFWFLIVVLLYGVPTAILARLAEKATGASLLVHFSWGMLGAYGLSIGFAFWTIVRLLTRDVELRFFPRRFRWLRW